MKPITQTLFKVALTIAAGVIVNIVAGVIEAARGERWGGLTGALGILLWTVTGASLLGIHRYQDYRDERYGGEPPPV